jgi:ornithine cyclodeaminase/alanine dehydrogenase-like protein (mu-crystallin family)
MARELSLEISAVDHPEKALEGADIITTITNARQPVFPGKSLPRGVHINAAGSNAATRAEIDSETVRRANRIFVDDLAQARFECGDLLQAYERNAFHWEEARLMADVVAGLTVGRQEVDDITLFESHGIALWDVALAGQVYERAVEQGIGELVAFGGS